jgi:hypothetical protein
MLHPKLPREALPQSENLWVFFAVFPSFLDILFLFKVAGAGF